MSLVISKLGRFTLAMAATGGVTLFCAGSALADQNPLASLVVPAVSSTSTTTSAATQTSTSKQTTHEVVTGTGSSVAGGGTSASPNATAAPAAGTVTTGSDTTAAPVAATETIPAAPSNLPVIAAAAAPAQTAAPAVAIVPVLAVAAPAPVSQDVIRRAQLTTVTMPETPVALASTLAEPVSPHKLPDSPKSNGFLTQLTSQLAGTIVPQLFKVASGLAGLPVALTVFSYLAIILLFVSLVISSYGLSLRRSGFVTAARGDVPSFIFATPHLNGYGSSNRTVVFFGGVRDQNPHNVSFPMLYMKGGE